MTGDQDSKICELCGERFYRVRSGMAKCSRRAFTDRRYCSDACRKKALIKAGSVEMMRVCEACGNQFGRRHRPSGKLEPIVDFLIRKTCSIKCRSELAIRTQLASASRREHTKTPPDLIASRAAEIRGEHAVPRCFPKPNADPSAPLSHKDVRWYRAAYPRLWAIYRERQTPNHERNQEC